MSPVVSANHKGTVALAFETGNISFVDLKSGSSTHILKEHTHGKCVSVQWSPIDQNVLCSAGWFFVLIFQLQACNNVLFWRYDGRIIMWDVRASKTYLCCFDYLRTDVQKSTKLESRKNNAKSVAHTGAILGCSFIQGGSYLVSIGKDNNIRLWNVLKGHNTLVNFGKTSINAQCYETTIQLASTDLSQNNFVFIPNGRGLNIYSAFDGELKSTYKGHFDSINCCLYNQASNHLYTGSKDRNVITWSSDYGNVEDKKKTFKRKTFSGFS